MCFASGGRGCLSLCACGYADLSVWALFVPFGCEAAHTRFVLRMLSLDEFDTPGRCFPLDSIVLFFLFTLVHVIVCASRESFCDGDGLHRLRALAGLISALTQLFCGPALVFEAQLGLQFLRSPLGLALRR
ncbi:hypothetical protein BKA93DRAFT_763111 [Sparassis latifolia]